MALCRESNLNFCSNTAIFWLIQEPLPQNPRVFCFGFLYTIFPCFVPVLARTLFLALCFSWPMSSSWLGRCMAHLEAIGFINLTSLKQERIKEFNTLGLLIRANVRRYLASSNDKSYGFDVLPVDNLNSYRLVSDCFRPLTKYALCFNACENHVGGDNGTELFNSNRSNVMNLVAFTDPSRSRNAFYTLHSTRYRLWRAISSSPESFFQSDIGKQSDGSEVIHLYYQSKKLKQEKTDPIYLETIKYLSDEEKIEDLLGESCSKHLIWCKINIDVASAAFMLDACDQSFNATKINTLWFHEYLAPYHTAFVIYLTGKSSVDSRIEDLVAYLIQEFKSSELKVFPVVSRIKPEADRDNFESFDKIGIPYVLCFDEVNIKRGVVGVRNRDTKLQENLHVSHLKVFLLLYLRKWNPQDLVDLKNLNIRDPDNGSGSKSKQTNGSKETS